MKITNELNDYLSELAKLEFDVASKEEIKIDLHKIISFVERLNEVNTDNVEPLVYLTEENPDLREDKSEFTINRKEALKNSPRHDSDYFIVPKVIKSHENK